MHHQVSLVRISATLHSVNTFNGLKCCLFCQIINIILAVMGSAWIIWLIFDINKYTQMMKEYWTSAGHSSKPFVYQSASSGNKAPKIIQVSYYLQSAKLSFFALGLISDSLSSLYRRMMKWNYSFLLKLVTFSFR